LVEKFVLVADMETFTQIASKIPKADTLCLDAADDICRQMMSRKALVP